MIKKIISYLLSLLLTLTLLGCIATIMISQTVLSENYMIELFDNNDYYTKTYNEIMETFKNNTIQSGLTEEVLEGIISQYKIYNDSKLVMDYLYSNGSKKEIEVASIREKLQKNIDEQIEKNNKKITPEEQEAIEQYINTIIKIYRNGILYIENYIEQAPKMINSASKIITKIQYITIATSVGILTVLIIMNKKKSLNYLSVTLMTSGALLVLAKIIENSSITIRNVLIFNRAFSNCLIAIVETITFTFLIIGITAFVIGFILNIIVNRRYVKRKKEM